MGPGTRPGTVIVENRYDFLDLSHLRLSWSIAEDGEPIAAGFLPTPQLAPGERTEVPVPQAAAPAQAGGERWLTLRAELAEATGWAPEGHVVAWGQVHLAPSRSSAAPGVPGAKANVTASGARLALGPADFDRRTGKLLSLGGRRLDGPVLALWRAPTDNDLAWSQRDAAYWAARGLNRLRHRTVSVDAGEDTLTVVVRSAAASASCGYRTTYRWDAEDRRLRLRVDTAPFGHWPEREDVFGEAMVDPGLPPEEYAELVRRDKAPSLGRIGLRWLLPEDLSRVRWFGAGPGEAYPDSRRAARIDRFETTVDRMQTPYVRPQDNGNRAEVRWAELTDPAGSGILIEGAPVFNFVARRWSEQHLAEARHQTDLVAEPAIHLHTDHAVQGIGSGAVGPGVLPQHRLEVRPAQFALTLTPLP
jgi:beta-galactosidase